MSEDLMTKIQNENAITGATEQWRCKKCNALRSRIHRLNTSVDGFQDLTPEERAQFMLDNQSTFSQDLLKNMHEVSLQARMRKSSSLFKKHGEYFDETDLRDKLKNKPDQLQRILTSGHTLQCHDRGCTMYWLPNYYLELAEEDSKTESAKREIEATSVIKRAKKPKREPQAAEANSGDTVPDEKALKLTEPQAQRLTKSKPLVEDMQFKLSQALLEAPKGDLAKHFKKASPLLALIILATQCGIGRAQSADDVNSVVTYSCPSQVPHSNFTYNIMLALIGGILFLFGICCGIMGERMRQNFRTPTPTRDVQSQGPCTYTALRGVEHPRFQPLAPTSWG